MSERTLKHLKEDWPKRWALKPEEVALVLGKDPSSRGVIQNIRDGMSKGNRYPGAQRIDGHWQLPLEALAEILEPAPTTVMLPPVRQSGRRSQIGPRMRFVIQSRFWEAVARAMGDGGLADDISQEGRKVHQELKDLDQDKRAARSKAELMAAIGDVRDTKPDGRRSKDAGVL